MSAAGWSWLLAACALAGLLLPLLPALIELWRRTDAAPLQVVRRQDTNIGHFAESFRTQIEALLTQRMLPPGEQVQDVEWKQGEPVRLVGPLARAFIGADEAAARLVRAVLVLAGDARLPERIVYEQEVYGLGSIHCGGTATLRAVYAHGALRLEARSVIARWAHARTRLATEPGCRLLGRASAGERILLGADTEFERLHAPLIRCGPPPAAPPAATGPRSAWAPSRGTAIGPRCLLVDGDCAIPAGVELSTDLVVRGRLRLGSGTRAAGSLKAHGDVEIGPGSIVLGSVVSQRNVVLGAHCRIRGPLIAEDTADLGSGCVIGTPGRPTTVSAADVRLAPGTQVSGTLWAHRSGLTATATPAAAS
ncbi:MAG: hypothetical protein AB7Q97_05150 [Gammaproteobacteria bacterium]